MTEELLALLKDVPPERLAAEGNRELALEHVQRFVSSEEDRARRRMEVRQARSVTDQVLVPLVGPSVLTTVRIEEGLHDVRWADDDARESARRAIEDAWADVGGPGDPPPVTPALGIGADVPVRGSSAYLGIYLAAVARFGDQPLHGNVVATGCFDAPLAHVAEKRRLFEEAARYLGAEALLYAGTHEVTGDRLVRVRSRREARQRVFHFDPWHRDAPVQRIHVHCGARLATPPRRFGDGVRPVELPGRLAPSDLPEALARVQEEVAGHDRVEVSIGGSVLLAAALGTEACNARATIRVVHREDVMWDNRASWPDDVERTTEAERHVLVGVPSATPPEGWEHHETPVHISPDDMAGVVHRFLRRHGAVPSLHLAFTFTPVAWAIAGMLKNRADVRYYQWTGGRNVPWFEQRVSRNVIDIPK